LVGSPSNDVLVLFRFIESAETGLANPANCALCMWALKSKIRTIKNKFDQKITPGHTSKGFRSWNHFIRCLLSP
jgi:hypothetical protein